METVTPLEFFVTLDTLAHYCNTPKFALQDFLVEQGLIDSEDTEVAQIGMVEAFMRFGARHDVCKVFGIPAALIPRPDTKITSKPTKKRASKQSGEEIQVVRRLCRGINYLQREASCGLGRVDILSPRYLVEVKQASGLKGALGQLLAYSKSYPDKGLVVAAFGEVGKRTWRLLKSLYAEHGIELELLTDDLSYNTFRAKYLLKSGDN